MDDERLMAAVRRFYTREEVESTYEQVFRAYADATCESVAITAMNFDGQGGNGQYVLDREAMRSWMGVLEARLQEMEGTATADLGSPTMNFSTRRLGT